MRYRIDIEYDGTNYAGWQKQGHSLSIQDVLEECVLKLANEKVEVVGSGRTDAGVHAFNQVAHFDLKNRQFSENTVKEGLNYYLLRHNLDKINKFKQILMENFGDFHKNYEPLTEQDIVIKSCKIVGDDFHARFSSKMRHYRYVISNRNPPLALNRKRAWHIREKLDLKPMQEACKLLLGKHDFSSFRDSQCQAPNPVKTISACEIHAIEDNIILDVSAKSFLHHMIRNIIGTLKDVGLGRISVDDFGKILEAKDRQKAGVNAPPWGLYLFTIDYGEE